MWRRSAPRRRSIAMSTNAEIALAILAAFGIVGLFTLMGAYVIIGMAWEKSPLRSRRGTAREGQPSGRILARRALTLRCPRCGRGQIFGSRFRMNQICPVCGVTFWKAQGEWLGPAIMDYMVATASALLAWAILVLLGASATLQLIVASLAAIVITAAMSRWSRSLWTVFLYISGDMSQTDPPKPTRRITN
jgi:uncharacterized protein (DUF983 family)